MKLETLRVNMYTQNGIDFSTNSLAKSAIKDVQIVPSAAPHVNPTRIQQSVEVGYVFNKFLLVHYGNKREKLR